MSYRIQGRYDHGGAFFVPCQVNGNYRWFMVDTGAVMTTISRRVVDAIGLDLTHPYRWLNVVSAHQTEAVPIIRLASLQVGGQRLTNLEVAVMDFPPTLRVDGLLGINFLRHFRACFEFKQPTLILRAG